MIEFQKKFLRERLILAKPQMFLAGFGKHPGEDEHFENGLATESLLEAKALLYDEGIRGQIKSKAWERLEPAQSLPAFDHYLVWAREEEFILGRLWSSSDGVGRSHFPMVLCAHCIGCPLPWALCKLLPRLDQLQGAFRATRDMSEVDARLEQERRELRTDLERLEAQGVEADTETDLAGLLEWAGWGIGHEGLLRVLYQIRALMSPYLSGQGWRGRFERDPRPQSIRLPAAGDHVGAVFLRWRSFLSGLLDPAASMLLLLPAGLGWLDVILGKPGTGEFFGLRASAQGLALASDVPYTLDENFKEEADRLIVKYCQKVSRRDPLPQRIFGA